MAHIEIPFGGTTHTLKFDSDADLAKHMKLMVKGEDRLFPGEDGTFVLVPASCPVMFVFDNVDLVRGIAQGDSESLSENSSAK